MLLNFRLFLFPSPECSADGVDKKYRGNSSRPLFRSLLFASVCHSLCFHCFYFFNFSVRTFLLLRFRQQREIDRLLLLKRNIRVQLIVQSEWRNMCQITAYISDFFLRRTIQRFVEQLNRIKKRLWTGFHPMGTINPYEFCNQLKY